MEEEVESQSAAAPRSVHKNSVSPRMGDAAKMRSDEHTVHRPVQPSPLSELKQELRRVAALNGPPRRAPSAIFPSRTIPVAFGGNTRGWHVRHIRAIGSA